MGEGTEFKGGRCLACGRGGYGMAGDGPRCLGCERFVLKDDRAGGDVGSWEEHVAAQAVPETGPLTLAKLDALLEGTLPTPAQGVSRRTSAAWDRAFFFDGAPTPRPKRKKRKPLKTTEVLAEVAAILRGGCERDG